MVSNSINQISTKYTLKESNQDLDLSGLRKTSQRALIIDIVRQGQGHLDADEVYRRARQIQPRLSLSTVYRNLQTLKKLGLIEEVHFDETHHHYEIKPATEHHHLVCLGCGQVIEFEYPFTNQVKENVAEAKDFEITGSEIRMTGYCRKCQQNK